MLWFLIRLIFINLNLLGFANGFFVDDHDDGNKDAYFELIFFYIANKEIIYKISHRFGCILIY